MPDKALTVEYPLNFDGSPRTSSDCISIAVVNDRLIFVAENNEDATLELVQELAGKVADYLPHTPVTSFGMNFIFEEKANDSLKALLELSDVGRLEAHKVSIQDTKYVHRFKLNTKIVNLTVSAKDETFSFNLNFHFELKTLTEFKEVISTNTILDLKTEAISLMTDVYDLELNTEVAK